MEQELMLKSGAGNFHVVAGGEKGNGLFTSRGFEKGELIYLFDYWTEEVMPMHMTNHSCSPNSEFNDEGELIALRDLVEGEEITYNYILAPTPASPWNFECQCMADICQGWISVDNQGD